MNFVDYIQSSSFKENYKISANGELFFHWANWRETCQLQKKSHGDGTHQVEYIDNALEFLKAKPIWYQRNFKTVKSNLFELYEAYLDPRLKATWHDFQKSTLVSLHHEAGPFISLTSMRWMDKSVYSLFVYRKLLTGYLPLRDFRLSADINLVAEINESPLNTIHVRLTQLSEKGLILSIDGHDYNKILKCENIAMKININSFKNTDSFKSVQKFKSNTEKANDTLIINGSSLANMSNRNNANYSSGDEYFFYVPYSEVNLLKSDEDLGKVFGDVVAIVEKEFKKELMKVSLKDELELVAA
ncbi:hypothetical protein [Halobacteriovorax sp.]|uniref:hypothetical protein n=1 Tax=Halobacteriovorax sp. TaxID=2020862 RepID=UPI00356A94C5